MSGPDDLPILAELEAAFAAMVRAELHGAGSASEHVVTPERDEAIARDAPSIAVPPPSGGRAPRPSRRLRRRGPVASRLPVPAGRRILVRALVAGALAGVVGATALATKSVVGHGDGETPRTLQHAGGHELALRNYQGRWCMDITYAGGVASRCVATPASDGVAPLSAVVPHGRLVVGLAGPNVERVTVRRSGRAIVVSTHAISGRRLRWFAAQLDAVRDESRHAAIVVPSPVGRAIADCTLGTATSCRAVRKHLEKRM